MVNGGRLAGTIVIAALRPAAAITLHHRRPGTGRDIPVICAAVTAGGLAPTIFIPAEAGISPWLERPITGAELLPTFVIPAEAGISS